MLTKRKIATVANATWGIKYCIVFHHKQKNINQPACAVQIVVRLKATRGYESGWSKRWKMAYKLNNKSVRHMENRQKMRTVASLMYFIGELLLEACETK